MCYKNTVLQGWDTDLTYFRGFEVKREKERKRSEALSGLQSSVMLGKISENRDTRSFEAR